MIFKKIALPKIAFFCCEICSEIYPRIIVTSHLQLQIIFRRRLQFNSPKDFPFLSFIFCSRPEKGLESRHFKLNKKGFDEKGLAKTASSIIDQWQQFAFSEGQENALFAKNEDLDY